MEVIYHRCCGIDVHAKFVYVCLLVDGRKETKKFSTMTAELIKLREWLVIQECTHVGIESTGVYWKPVFNILEGAMKVILVNPEHARVLRGRKTDRLDSRRLADLLSVGLLEPSFIPPPHIRELRELTRYRESLVRTHSAVANRIQKVTESGNIKLGQVASNVLGASGRAMLSALAAGQTDVSSMVQLAKGKLKQKSADLELALQGDMNKSQRYVLGELLKRVKELEAAQDKVNKKINQAINDTKHPELFKAWELLQTIPGIGSLVAEVIIAEIGVNLRESFPTAKHLASWAGLCPGNKSSGGKRLSGKTRNGNCYFRSAVVQAAWASTHTKQTFLSSRYHRLARRMGKRKALVAVAHTLTAILFNILDRGEPYKELGADYFDRLHSEKQRKYFVKRLEALGYSVTPRGNSPAA
jgi:transposase